MQVTKGTWRMREQCVPGSLSSSHAREPGNEARIAAVGASMHTLKCIYTRPVCHPCMSNKHIVQVIWKSGQSILILV